MFVALLVLLTLAETPFESSVDRAFSSARDHNWKDAASALDRASIDDPAAFEANNLYYLRGRIAEKQQDWAKALEKFARIDRKNSLYSLATWHGASASLKLGAAGRAEQLLDELPDDFPTDLRMLLVRDAPPTLALKIVEKVPTREGRLQRAILMGDTVALWALVRERNSDDAALQSAVRLVPVAATATEWKDLAGTFFAHRQFSAAVSAYRKAAEDPRFAAESQYQLARMQLLSQDYANAAASYSAVAAAFPGTDWERDARYQIGNAYWRLRRYEDAEKAYLDYIDRYKSKGASENAIRDLVDIYRGLGRNEKAIALIDRTLTGKLSAATRQVLLFTKSKILYSQGKYSAALQAFRQLKGANLVSTAGGTSPDELVYFEALALAKTGNASAAKAAWQRVAANPETYYGQRAVRQLGTAPGTDADGSTACGSDSDRTLENAIGRLMERRRPFLVEARESNDTLSELLFLQLWDEGSLWIDQTRRPDAALAADLSYAGGRYNRAITYADRMPRANPTAEALIYPAGFRPAICRAAAKWGIDPLWLQAIIWQESKYDPKAQSAAAARGLMQFIPDTAEAIASAAGIQDLTLDRLYDPETSIQLGAYYWSTLLSEFKSPELALAAYNGGPDNVRRWRDKWPDSDGEFFVSDIGFTETKRYVQAVFRARAAYGRIP